MGIFFCECQKTILRFYESMPATVNIYDYQNRETGSERWSHQCPYWQQKYLFWALTSQYLRQDKDAAMYTVDKWNNTVAQAIDKRKEMFAAQARHEIRQLVSEEANLLEEKEKWL
jgi:hypothetical protein